MEDKYSVLMSIYHRESPQYFREALESIYKQTLPPAEVVLMVDGPVGPDLEAEIEACHEAHPDLKVIRLEKNGGLGPALAEGLKHCTYQLVGRMDTDDVCRYDRFERQTSYLSEHTDVDVVGSWIAEFIDEPAGYRSVRRLPSSPDELALYARHRNPLNHPSVMFRKEAVERVGSYRDVPLFEDYDLWVRMLMQGSRLANIPQCLLYFRISPDTYRRRGGRHYILLENRFIRSMRRMGFISHMQCLKNMAMRLAVRLMPNSLRAFVYSKLLR